jgi:hypothetical protein
MVAASVSTSDASGAVWLTLSRASGPPGADVTATGCCAGLPVFFAPERLSYPRILDSPPRDKHYVRLGVLQEGDAAARAHIRFRVPAAKPGVYRLIVFCQPCWNGPKGSLLPASFTFRVRSRAIAGIARLSVVRSCGEAVDLPAQGPPNRRLLFDRVAVPPVRFVHRPVYFPSRQKPLPYFAKFGLFLRDREDPIELAVPEPWRDRFAISWGDYGPQQASVVRIFGCTSTRRWVAYPGGFYVRKPACVPLLVRSGGKSTRIWIAMGTACGR